LEVMRGMADNSVDAIVTDPPYGLSFMGKKWDYDVPEQAIWEECLRVLKPGGHLLAFAGTRTQHRMAVRIEDGGFEIRDMIAWVYGSGFPKSLDVSKAIDKAAGMERQVIGKRVYADGHVQNSTKLAPPIGTFARTQDDRTETAPATDAARQWQGWGTALKPALEPITVARKPLVGTVAANVLAHGTGAINVDGCRIGFASDADREKSHANGLGPVERFQSSKAIYEGGKQSAGFADTHNPSGRWPANLIHDGSDEVVGCFPETNGGTAVRRNSGGNTFGGDNLKPKMADMGYGDTGSAARFFYCAKASKSDRGESNGHPTVKPTELMRYLVRLVTQPGGTVLDPFTGSGSTGKAAVLEGFEFIGIEREAEYVAIAEARIVEAQRSLGLFA